MISIILPTFNEAENLPLLIPRLADVLKETAHEIIIVDDDSPDRTWQKAEELSRAIPQVRVLRRIGRRGLSSAVVEGCGAAKGEILAVMDADAQHDPSLVPRLVSALQAGARVAVGSRYMPGGSVGEWIADRRILSTLGTTLAQWVTQTHVSDPLSGFFAIDRSLYRSIEGRLRPTGFKILLEILAHVPPATPVAEIPLVFQMRRHGNSKLSAQVHWEFLRQIVRLGWLRAGGYLQRAQWGIFLFLSLAIAGFLAPRARTLLPVYLDGSLRSAVAEDIAQAAQIQGWLLSDIELVGLRSDGLILLHRPHHRGSDETRCYVLRSNPHSLTICDE